MLSAWQRKQSSYSAVTGFTTAPAAFIPSTPASAPEAVGAVAGVLLAACESWQSAHSTWRGGLKGSSMGSCTPRVLNIGWMLILLKSACTSLAATVPLWQEKQFFSSSAKF